MKQLITLLLCSILALNLAAQEPDTTKVKTINKKNVVTVIEDSDKVHVIVGNERGIEVITNDWGDTTYIRLGRRKFKVIDGDNGTSVKYEKELRRKNWTGNFNAHWSGLDVGMNFFQTSDFSMGINNLPTSNYSIYKGTEYEELGEVFNLRPNKSLSWNINFLEYAFTNRRNNFAIVTGMGVSLNDYAFDLPVTIEKKDGHGMIVPKDISVENSSVKKSKLHINYLTAPLILEIKTPLRMGSSNLHIAAGVIGSLYLGSHTKYKYQNKNKEKIKGNFHINQWKYELTGRISFGDFTIFANYSMTSIFRDNLGPDIHPILIGISFPNI